MTLLGSAKKDVDQDKDGENVSKLEAAEVVLVKYCCFNKHLKYCLLLYQRNNLVN